MNETKTFRSKSQPFFSNAKSLEFLSQSVPKVQENKVFWIYLNFSKMESAVMSVDVSLRLKTKQKMHQCLLSISIKFFLQTFWQKFSHRASETANVGLAAGVPEALSDFIFPLHWSKCISLYFMKILTRLETNKDFFPYIHKNLHFWKGYYNPCSRNWLFPLADVTCDPIFIEIYIFYFRTFLISLFNFLGVRNINQYFRKMKYVPSFNSVYIQKPLFISQQLQLPLVYQ